MKMQSFYEEDEIGESSSKVVNKGKFYKRIGVEEVYKQIREEMEKARREREEVFQVKK